LMVLILPTSSHLKGPPGIIWWLSSKFIIS
jgi:hypothetical protein